MAKYLCYASEDELLAVLCESCQRHAITLNRETPYSASIVQTGWRKTAWQIQFITQACESPRQTQLMIQTQLSFASIWLRRVLLITGVGLATGGCILAQYPRFDVMPLALILSGVLVLMAFLQYSSITMRHLHTLLTEIHRDLEVKVKTKNLDPFEPQSPWLDHFVLLPFLVIVFLAQIPMTVGLFVGMSLLIPVCSNIFLFIIKSRISGWRGVLHGIHSIWMKVVLMATASITVILLLGTLLHCRVYHPETFRHSMHRVMNEAISLALADTRNGQSAPLVIAEQMLDSLQINSDVLIALVVIVTLVLLFLLSLAVLGVRDGIQYWQQTHLGKPIPLKPINQSSQMTSVKKTNGILIVVNALLFGLSYWIAAMVSIDIFYYCLFSESLWFHPLGWSLALYKAMWHEVGVPILVTDILVTVVLVIALLPGLALVLTAIQRMVVMIWNDMADLRSPTPQEIKLMETYGQWLNRSCQQAGVRIPRIKVTNNPRPLLFAKCSLIPFRRQYIVVTDGSLEHFNEQEMNALLAHEVCHLKRDAFQIQLLKTLSILLLCPVHYLLILYDFTQREYEADKFAVEMLSDKAVVRSVLVKLRVTSHVTPDSNNSNNSIQSRYGYKRIITWLSQRSLYVRALPLYFDDSIFAAAYPTLRERLDEIDYLDCPDSHGKKSV